MSSTTSENSNKDKTVTMPANAPNKIIPAGCVGKNPQSTLNPTVPHTKADLDNHANQLNPNNPRYAGHKERIAAEQASREAAALHQEAQAAFQYATQMEAAALQAQMLSKQLHQEAALCAKHASAHLSNHPGGRGRGRGHGRGRGRGYRKRARGSIGSDNGAESQSSQDSGEHEQHEPEGEYYEGGYEKGHEEDHAILDNIQLSNSDDKQTSSQQLDNPTWS